MKKYYVESQRSHDERMFNLIDKETGESFLVDFYTNGEIEPPASANKTNESFTAWLNSFVGKTLEIERITPYMYFTIGKIKVTNPPTVVGDNEEN